LNGPHNPREHIAQIRDENDTAFDREAVRGALKDLQQTFQHKWVYLAELLQNALDAGATEIRVAIQGDTLVFEHDGREFRAEEVRSLCLKGCSTKGPTSLGFMGVGFKSVFHSFRRASVSSGPWRFFLEVGWREGDRGERIRQWIGAVLPEWDGSLDAPSANMRCRFVLAQRLDGLATIQDDLDRVLQDDLCLLPLLARRGVQRLDWNGAIWDLCSLPGQSSQAGVGLEHVHAKESGGEQREWCILSRQYEPSFLAVKEYLESRQLEAPEEALAKSTFYEQASGPRAVELFFEVDSHGVPVLPERGKVFATLPIEMRLPMRLHLQADWLLVVTRASPQNLDSSRWHDEIRAQLPPLLSAYLRWLTHEPTGEGWERGYLGLPDLSTTHDWLNEAFATQLRAELSQLAFLPGFGGKFLSPQDAVFPPDAFQKLAESAWHPDLLLGYCAVRLWDLPREFRAILGMLDLAPPMSSDYLESLWGPSGISVWLEAVTRDGLTRELALILLYAALQEAEEEAPDIWATGELVCVPAQDGQWDSLSSLRRLPGEWPSVPETVRCFLEPIAGRTSDFVDVVLCHSLATSGTRDSREWRAVRYLQRSDQESLEGMVAKWWSTVPPRPNEIQVDQALALTRWVCGKQRHRGNLVARLLCDDKGTVRLLSPSECVLSDPYAPSYRRRLFRDTPVVSPKYIDGSDLGPKDWRGFFQGLDPRPQGEFALRARVRRYNWQSLSESFPGFTSPEMRSTWVSSEYELSGQVWPDKYTVQSWLYHVVDTCLPENWPSGEATPGEMRDAVDWLAECVDTLAFYKSLRLLYWPFRTGGVANIVLNFQRRPEWVDALSTRAWVPVRHANQVLRPAEVLSKADFSRPYAPVADLPEELLPVLEEAGVVFGSDIPRTPIFMRLQTEGPVAPIAQLLKLLEEATSQAQEDGQARDELLRLLIGTPLAPTSPRDDLPRVCCDRVVRRAGKGGFRSNLGGWVVALEDFPPGTQARKLLDLIDTVVDFPDSTTGGQALAYLRHVWKSRPGSEAVRRLVPSAYSYVLDEVERNQPFLETWNQALDGACVFAHRGSERGWFDPNQAYLNDLGFFLPRHSPELNAWLPPVAAQGHLGETSDEQCAVAQLLGLRKLSERVTVSYRYQNSRPASTEVAHALECLRDIVAAVRLEPSGIESEDSEDFAPGDSGADLLPLPQSHIVDSLAREVLADGKLVDGREVFVALDGASLLLCGRASAFAGDLAEALTGLWRLTQRLALQIAAALTLADDRRAFDDAICVLRRKLDLAADDAPAPVSQADAPPGRASGIQRSRPTIPENGRAREPEQETQAPIKTGGSDWAGGQDEGEPSRSTSVAEGSRDDEGPSSGYDMDTRAARVEYHVDQLRRLLAAEALPGPERADPAIGTGHRSDEEFRRAVVEYERRSGRHAELRGATQAGFDLESYDAPESQSDRRLVRRIEVKGRTAPWTGGEIVILSHRQFTDQLEHFSDAGSWDYWLYVVTRITDGRYAVAPVKNPARATASFAIRADVWGSSCDAPLTVDVPPTAGEP